MSSFYLPHINVEEYMLRGVEDLSDGIYGDGISPGGKHPEDVCKPLNPQTPSRADACVGPTSQPPH